MKFSSWTVLESRVLMNCAVSWSLYRYRSDCKFVLNAITIIAVGQSTYSVNCVSPVVCTKWMVCVLILLTVNAYYTSFCLQVKYSQILCACFYTGTDFVCTCVCVCVCVSMLCVNAWSKPPAYRHAWSNARVYGRPTISVQNIPPTPSIHVSWTFLLLYYSHVPIKFKIL